MLPPADRICLPSEGFARIPGGNLQWQCSREFVSGDKAALQLQTHSIFNEFLKKQDQAMSLFIESILSVVPHDTLINGPQKAPNSPTQAPQRDIQRDASPSKNSPTQSVNEDTRGAASPSKKEDRLSIEDVRYQLDLKESGVHISDHSHMRSVVSANVLYKIEMWSDWWHNLEEPERTSCLAKLLSSGPMQSLTVAVIMVNTIFIAIGVNHEMETMSNSPPELVAIGEKVFLAYYVLEMVAKLVVHGPFFFANNEMWWNMFDLLIVLNSVLDYFVSMSSNFSFLRSFRMLRATRALRALRVITFLRDLRVMLACILGSFGALFWCVVLLFLFGAIIAIFYVGSLAIYLRQADDVSDFEERRIRDKFGSVTRALFTLYRLVTGLIEGSELVDMLERTGFRHVFVLVGVVGFYQISVINILSGVFLEKALHQAQPEREREIIERRHEVMESIEVLKSLCLEIPVSEPGIIQREEFMNAFKQPDLRFAFENEDLDIRDAEAFFDILETVSGQARVDFDTFVSGCMRMRGLATSIDLQHADLHSRKCFRDITTQMRSFLAGSDLDTSKTSDSDALLSHIRSMQAAITHLEERLAPLSMNTFAPPMLKESTRLEERLAPSSVNLFSTSMNGRSWIV